MSKCLRCGAGPEWLQGRVPTDETQARAAIKRDAELATLRAEAESLRTALREIRAEVEGAIDGAPDAGAMSRQANHIDRLAADALGEE